MDQIMVVMPPEETQLPTESDFARSWLRDLDQQHAIKQFLGKTADEAEAMFRQNFLFYQEDLSSMRAPAFRFYIMPAIKYLLSSDSTGDSDAASTFCSLLEWRLKTDPATLMPIAGIVREAVERVVAEFDRFDCEPEIYGDVPARYKVVAAKLAA